MSSKILAWENAEDRQQIAQFLRSGKVIVGSSDTVPGLLADATQNGFEQLNAIKGRFEKPYIVLISDAEKIDYFAVMPNERVQKIVNACWPGPLTIIFKAKDALPAYVKSATGTIALRVPKHEGLCGVAQHFNGLFSTSANLAGQAIPQTIQEIDSAILDKVVAIVNDTYKKDGLPSTILDCSSDDIKVIREGAYSIELLEQIAGQTFKK